MDRIMARRLSCEWCISGFSLSLFNAYGYPTFYGPKILHHGDFLSLFSPVYFSFLVRVFGVIIAGRGAVVLLIA